MKWLIVVVESWDVLPVASRCDCFSECDGLLEFRGFCCVFGSWRCWLRELPGVLWWREVWIAWGYMEQKVNCVWRLCGRAFQEARHGQAQSHDVGETTQNTADLTAFVSSTMLESSLWICTQLEFQCFALVLCTSCRWEVSLKVRVPL